MSSKNRPRSWFASHVKLDKLFSRSDQNRNKTGKSKNHVKSSTHQPDVVTNSVKSTAAQEIMRLEALCEARTKELNMVKLQLKSGLQGFDAMAALVKYMSYDLDAFSCPLFLENLKTAKTQLVDAQSQIGELQGHKARLEQELVELNQLREQTTNDLVTQHQVALTDQDKVLTTKHLEELDKVKQGHTSEFEKLKLCHENQVTEMKTEHATSLKTVQNLHKEEINKLQGKHEGQMEELHKQHRDKLEEITHRFDSIKLTLSEKVDTLRCECEELRTRARDCEEALQRDSDYKVQLALVPYKTLPEEISSLKMVIEMRNEEIQKLRQKNVDLSKQLEELPAAREKILFLQQKVENLEAIVNIKTDHEKQLHEKCQILMRKYDKESKAKKRLSMDYEQVVWKMAQSPETSSQENLFFKQLSRSPPGSESSSPDTVRKTRSPLHSEREPTPSRSTVYKRSTSSGDSLERKLKRRSANFLLDERKRDSPTSSPIRKRQSPTLPDSGVPTRGVNPERMCQSLNDVDAFEAPQGLPSPPQPPELQDSFGFTVEILESPLRRKSHKDENSEAIDRHPEKCETTDHDVKKTQRKAESETAVLNGHSTEPPSSPEKKADESVTDGMESVSENDITGEMASSVDYGTLGDMENSSSEESWTRSEMCGSSSVSDQMLTPDSSMLTPSPPLEEPQRLPSPPSCHFSESELHVTENTSQHQSSASNDDSLCFTHAQSLGRQTESPTSQSGSDLSSMVVEQCPVMEGPNQCLPPSERMPPSGENVELSNSESSQSGERVMLSSMPSSAETLDLSAEVKPGGDTTNLCRNESESCSKAIASKQNTQKESELEVTKPSDLSQCVNHNSISVETTKVTIHGGYETVIDPPPCMLGNAENMGMEQNVVSVDSTPTRHHLGQTNQPDSRSESAEQERFPVMYRGLKESVV